jgi:hypothetical protein
MSKNEAEELAGLWSLPYSVENQTKVAQLLSGDENELSAEERFEGVMMLLSLISARVKGKPTTLSHSLATAILGRMCVTAMSTQVLFKDHEDKRLVFLDSASIAILSRALIEAGIMYWYLTEPVGDEVWAFRLQVMKVHDAAARVRFWKALMPEEADKERVVLAELRDELKQMPLFRQRPEAERTKLRAGEAVYVNGMRSIVRQMGVDQDYYDGVYNYLSAQVHSTPISYFRDSDDDTKQMLWHRGFSQYSLAHAAQMMARVALREIELSSLEDQFDAAVLEECRKMISAKGKQSPPPST